MEPCRDQKETIREDDGLQVDHTRMPQHVGQDHEGLQVYQRADAIEPDNAPFFQKREPGQIPTIPSTQARRSRKKLFVGIGALVGIVIILAAVLGGVLGSRAARSTSDGDHDGDSGSMATTGQDPNGQDSKLTQATGRVRSTKGVWNGTAITSSWVLDATNTTGIVLYQDYTGAVIQQSWRWDSKAGGVAFDFPPVDIHLNAGNGTGLSVSCYGDQGICQLVYVCPNGTLADAFLNKAAFDSKGAFNGKWTDGNLTAYNWTAPLDNRPALLLQTDKKWYGREFNAWGARLWVGTADNGGKLLQRSYDWKTRSWDTGPALVMQGGSTYGGVQVQSGDIDTSSSNTTLYTTAADGTLQYQIQIYTKNQTQWPHGPQFFEVVNSNVTAAVNTSIYSNWPTKTDQYVFYPSDTGLLNRMQLNLEKKGTDVWGNRGPTFNKTMVMPGTSMDQEGPAGDYSLFFYQETGDTLSWISLWGPQTWKQGKTVPRS